MPVLLLKTDTTVAKIDLDLKLVLYLQEATHFFELFEG